MGEHALKNTETQPAPLRFQKLRQYFRDGRAPWVVVEKNMGFLSVNQPEAPLDKQVSAVEFSATLRRRFTEELKYEATDSFADRYARESAKGLPPRSGVIRAALAAVALLIICCIAPRWSIASIIIICSIYFLLIAIVRIGLAAAAAAGPRPQTRLPLADPDLPTVTILAPLFREAHALPGLVKAIENIDYPAAKLDVKLLLEECDAETLREARRLQLDRRYDIIVAPPSEPQTKPKACNYGLHCARGDLIVIYDAEDEPEADQLRIAAEVFAAAEDDLACVQARLNYYNPDDNWLTRLFTLEYCLWFDHFLPALDRLGAPVPLGGTSNIFRTDILVEVGGWDPHNVTEDADLGLRLARRGFRTAVLNSTTFEEANCRTGNWMRQRSRWMKGFIQTWLVHRRAEKGAFDWRTLISVDFFIGGTAFAALANPLLWVFMLGEKFGAIEPFGALPTFVEQANLAALIFSNISFIALAAFAPLRRGLGRLSPAAIMMPVYWIMMSIAAWRAVWQLFTRPYYWEKTDHGLSEEARARRKAALVEFGLEPEAGDSHLFSTEDGYDRPAAVRKRISAE